MGRLLERLLSDAESAPAANLANPANLAPAPAPIFANSQDSQGGEAVEIHGALLAVCDAHAERERMDKGLPPLAWGEPVARTCTGCGPVLLWPESPPVVTACPWCFRRKVGKPIARVDRQIEETRHG